MAILLKAFDNQNNLINLPNLLWYHHLIKRRGVEETFTLGFAKQIPFNLTKVIILKDSKKESVCFVDSIESKTDSSGFKHQIKLKNNLCRLFENQIQPKILKKISLSKILKTYAKSYNLSCNIDKAYSFEIENFYVDMGMTVWDVIEFFFQTTFKKDIYINENNELVFPFSPTTPLIFCNDKNSINNLVNGIPYHSLKIMDDRSNLISDAFIKIVYEDNDSDFLHLTEQNQYAVNCNIERVKFCNVPLRWQVLPKSGSDYMVQQENKKRFSYKISTFEKITIFPGMIAKIKEVDDNKNLVVTEVFNSCDESSKKTTIYLRDIM